MTTCRDIVTRALRMAGIVGKGREPKARELDDGMFALQGLFDGWFAGGMFGRLTDYYAEGGYEAEVGQRVFYTGTAPTLPELVDSVHPPRDLAAIEFNNASGRGAHIWDRSGWVRIDALDADDDAPLALRGAEGLAACLAASIAEEYGAPLTASVVSKASNFRTNLRLNAGAEREVTAGQWF